MRDPKAMLLHPDYHAKTKQDQDPHGILPDSCIREGHKKWSMGHLVSRAVLKLIADQYGKVTVLGTGYKEDGKNYLSAAGSWPFHLNQATAFPGICELCERNFVSADNIGGTSQGVDLLRALFEACARNTHHALWIADLFNNTLRVHKTTLEKRLIKDISGISGLEQTNEQIAKLARECLPPLPDDVAPAGTPLERDEHFRHFVWSYPDTQFRVAVSTEVILQHENDPATQALAFINVVPQRESRDAGWHTAAALSLPLQCPVPSVWDAVLDNSEHCETSEHQRIVSNLATRSPDGVCFASDHFSALPWKNGILPNLLENPFPGLTLPVVNVIGSDLSGLANCSFNLFA